eukprot:TRINITY_DN98641_c0_g1_i1.p1 TRINITY_DN98641_c0_g1~~TRINITY_DN98641_c0_g1_i1.p1  ORF type:complete len:424 (-),score=77.25 TRINITY_DN98641_c0_g1_i1:231-1502(-)
MLEPSAAHADELLNVSDGETVRPAKKEKLCHWKRNSFVTASLVAGIASVLIATLSYANGKMELHYAAFIVGGYCTVVATWLSCFLVYLHLTTLSNPSQQQKIIRILIMVPVYAVDSWLGLVLKDHAIYLNLLRETYESYVIYCFFAYLIDLLGGTDECARKLQNFADGPQKGYMKHPVPMCCLQPFALGHRFIKICRYLVIQYMILKPLCTILAIILIPYHHYEEGHWSPKQAYMYLSLTVNISVIFAFTALYYFYLATCKDLKQFSPVPKFLCVKAVIFLSFWQYVMLGLFVKMKIINCLHCTDYTNEQIADGVNQFLICVEMMIISLFHRSVFPHTPYHTTGLRSPLRKENVRRAFSVRDVVEDVTSAVDEVKEVITDLTPIGRKASPSRRVDNDFDVSVSGNETPVSPSSQNHDNGPNNV